jgi:hypothetical protein
MSYLKIDDIVTCRLAILVAVIDELPPRFRLDRSKMVVWILELGTEALCSKDAKLPDLNSVEMAISRQPKDRSG